MMLDEQEQFLLHQIRILLKQLDERQTKQKDEEKPDKPDPDVMLNNQNSSYEDDIDNVFPYAFGDWDNFDFNYPLYWALCDVQGTRSGDPG